MKDHLKADLETNKIESARPAFHKIGFNGASFYLTKSHFSDVRGWDHGKNSIGKYYLFPWWDFRAKGILGFELGDSSPYLGEVIAIGSYTPSMDDLLDVKYTTKSGKAYFKSALAELGYRKVTKEKTTKIDAKNFMRMKEIVPTGAQGKAIYGDGDYIIDGAAGTGKSTTVLQKIKLLEVQGNIKTSQIKVVVKNTKVLPRFKELLQSIDVTGVSILTSKTLIDNYYPSDLSISKEQLVKLNKLAHSALLDFDSIFNKRTLFSQTYETDELKLETLSSYLGDDKNYKSIENEFLNNVTKIRKLQINDNKKIDQKRKDLTDKVRVENERLTSATILKNQKSFLRRQLSRIGVGTLPNENNISLGDKAMIRKQVHTFKLKLQFSIDKNIKLFQEKRLLEETKLLGTPLHYLKTKFIETTCKTMPLTLSKILFWYFNKLYYKDFKIHTIIIDEAQSFSAVDIELIRLTSQNTILAGDELQNESSTGIGLWRNLAIHDSFEQDAKLKIFQLKHNFRQTFELGSVSYNYRQLLLNKNIENIKSEYFEDQIGFSKPTLKLISGKQSFLDLIKNRIQYIKDTFKNSHTFPLVIFYEKIHLSRLIGIVGSAQLTYCVDDHNDLNCDILFVNVMDISGREFPVVLAPLMNATKKNTIYIMLSRAKFNLTIFTETDKNIEENIQTLCTLGLIEKSSSPI